MSYYDISKYAKEGAIARQAKTTAEQRSKISSFAAKVRWAKYREAKAKLPPDPAVEENKELKELRFKYKVLREFIFNKGGDPDEILEMVEADL
jgi:hypothetical protein